MKFNMATKTLGLGVLLAASSLSSCSKKDSDTPSPAPTGQQPGNPGGQVNPGTGTPGTGTGVKIATFTTMGMELGQDMRAFENLDFMNDNDAVSFSQSQNGKYHLEVPEETQKILGDSTKTTIADFNQTTITLLVKGNAKMNMVNNETGKVEYEMVPEGQESRVELYFTGDAVNSFFDDENNNASGAAQTRQTVNSALTNKNAKYALQPQAN